MTSPRPSAEAALAARDRRRRRSARHAGVLGGVAALLVLTGVVSGGAALGVWDLPFVEEPPRRAAPSDAASPVGEPAPPVCGDDGTAGVGPATDVTVTVRNGTTREGLASATADELAARGFQVAEVATSDPTASGLTEVRYPPADQARGLAVVLHTGATDVAGDPAATGVVVTLGEDFTGLRAPEEVQTLLNGGEVFPGCRAVAVDAG
jgi:hypothetical protein